MSVTAVTAEPIPNPVSAVTRIGRPPGGDPMSARSTEPWLALGISQSTFYRRLAVIRAALPPKPVQRAAHVDAWLATLDPFTRLDHRSWVRDCIRACRHPREWSEEATALAIAASRAVVRIPALPEPSPCSTSASLH